MIPAGITVALATPVDEDGALDEAGLGRLVRRVVDAGVAGISPCGSTGEGARLDRASRLRVTESVRALAPDLPVISGVSFGSPRECLAELAALADLGAHAALVPPPSYYPMTDDEVYALYAHLAAESPIPLVLYHIPMFTAVPITPAAVGRLAELPGVVGIKDSGRDLEYFLQVLAATKGADFTVLTGTDTLLVESLGLGAAGAICASANVVPELSVGIHRAFTAGDPARARQLQDRLTAVVFACRRGSPPAGWKAALSLDDVCGPWLVPPGTALPTADRTDLADTLRRLGSP
jgi:4-hydroxy-tetrahydrodipicolinate synthase